MISEAEKRLRKLESERLRLDHELRCTREKIVMSERGKELIEARMKVECRLPRTRTVHSVKITHPISRETNKHKMIKLFIEILFSFPGEGEITTCPYLLSPSCQKGTREYSQTVLFIQYSSRKTFQIPI